MWAMGLDFRRIKKERGVVSDELYKDLVPLSYVEGDPKFYFSKLF